MSCHDKFYKKLKLCLVVNNVTVEDVAAIKELLDERRKQRNERQGSIVKGGIR